jgi:hypothetical protein
MSDEFSGMRRILRRHGKSQDLRMRRETAVRPRDLRGFGLMPQRTGTITRVMRPFSCCYKVANVTSLPANSGSNAYPVYWPVSGMVRMMNGTTVGDGSRKGQSAIGVEITILDGREDLFKSAGAAGNAGPDYNNFASLFGLDGDRDFILERPVTAALAWQVRFFNFSDTAYTPDLTFYVDEDPRGVHRYSDRRIEVPSGTTIEVYNESGQRRQMVAELGE